MVYIYEYKDCFRILDAEGMINDVINKDPEYSYIIYTVEGRTEIEMYFFDKESGELGKYAGTIFSSPENNTVTITVHENEIYRKQ